MMKLGKNLTAIKYIEFAPVNCSAITGANCGPCKGHLLMSQIKLPFGFVGQKNWPSWLSQTGDKSPDVKQSKECPLSFELIEVPDVIVGKLQV